MNISEPIIASNKLRTIQKELHNYYIATVIMTLLHCFLKLKNYYLCGFSMYNGLGVPALKSSVLLTFSECIIYKFVQYE